MFDKERLLHSEAFYYKDISEVAIYHLLRNPTEMILNVLENIEGSHNVSRIKVEHFVITGVS